MKTPRILIKLGGAALIHESALASVTPTIQRFRRLGYHVILVHGGGPAINLELNRQGIGWTFIGGQRVTTAKMLEVVESVLCGHVNRDLVRHFRRHRIPAIGLSGSDNRTLTCTQASPELGLVGRIEKVETNRIEALFAKPGSAVPVIAPLGTDLHGQHLNINADWAASHLAVALGAEQLLFLTDQEGILDEEGELIQVVGVAGLKSMIDSKMVTGGMLTKVLAVLHALQNGVPSVRVLKAQEALAIAQGGPSGTLCSLEASFSNEYATGEKVHVAV